VRGEQKVGSARTPGVTRRAMSGVAQFGANVATARVRFAAFVEETAREPERQVRSGVEPLDMAGVRPEPWLRY